MSLSAAAVATAVMDAPVAQTISCTEWPAASSIHTPHPASWAATSSPADKQPHLCWHGVATIDHRHSHFSSFCSSVQLFSLISQTRARKSSNLLQIAQFVSILTHLCLFSQEESLREGSIWLTAVLRSAAGCQKSSRRATASTPAGKTCTQQSKSALSSSLIISHIKFNVDIGSLSWNS